MALTAVQYSDGLSPEGWQSESAWFHITTTDSLDTRLRTFEFVVANPRNTKDSVYTYYRRIRLTDGASGQVIFLGRVISTDPSYDSTYGQVLKIICAGYELELFERKVNSDYSDNDANGNPWAAGKPKRSDLISALITNYTYSGTVTQSIEDSGSSETVARDFSNNDGSPAQMIENLASEDYWTNETWGAAWRWNNTSYNNNTSEANSSGGVAFSFLGATNHYYYLGQNNPFLGAEFTLAVTGSYGVQTWQYWNGTQWSNLTLLQTYDFTTATGTIKWSLPTNWATKAFSASDPHAAAPPDTTSRYWVRVSVATYTTTATVNQIVCSRGCGYDFRVNDSQVFSYFRRGSLPSGGPSASGLTITLGGSDGTNTRAMLQDYQFSENPKELITRVTCRGTAIDGTTQSYTATDSALETQYSIVKEKIDYVWGADMSAATLLTYVTNRAKALLSIQGGTITRGEFSIFRYPYYGASKTTIRVGDLVHITIGPQSIDDDFLVLEVKYEEPPGIARFKVVSMVWGRSYSPFELASVLAGLRNGQDISVATARIQDLMAGSAKIANAAITTAKIANLAVTNAQMSDVSIDKLTAGELSVVGTIVAGGKFVTGASGSNRIEITNSRIAGYNSSNQLVFYLMSSDGKAYCGAGSVILDRSGVSLIGTPGPGQSWLTIYNASGQTLAFLGAISSSTVQLIAQGTRNLIIGSIDGYSFMGSSNSNIYFGALGENYIQLDPYSGGYGKILPVVANEDDIGDNSTYWGDIYCDHVYEATPSPKVIKDALLKLRAVKFHNSIDKKKKSIISWDKDTFPEETVRLIEQADWDFAEKKYQTNLSIYNDRLLRKGEISKALEQKPLDINLLAEFKMLDAATKIAPVKSIPQKCTSINDMIGFLLSAIKELDAKIP